MLLLGLWYLGRSSLWDFGLVGLGFVRRSFVRELWRYPFRFRLGKWSWVWDVLGVSTDIVTWLVLLCITCI